MSNLNETFLKSFTRYLIPGFTFPIIIAIPFLVYNCDIFDEVKNLNIFFFVIIAVVAGYLLDSLGAYGWTPMYSEYKQIKLDLDDKLSKISSIETQNSGSDSSTPDQHTKVNDPDQHTAILWLKNEKLYNRIFVERSEWVLIL
jgi:hypothetical protein